MKSVIVTGASGLLGFELLRLLSDWHIIAIDIKDKPNDLQKNISFIQWDLSDINSYPILGKKIKGLTNNLKGLVNNAALNPSIENLKEGESFGKFEDLNLKKWERDIQINLTSPVFLIKEFLPFFNHNEGRCKIVNVGSVAGLLSPNQNIYKQLADKMGIEIFKPISYSITKAALLMVTKYLSTYLGGRDFNVNAVAPGGIENKQDNAFVQEYCKQIPMGRMAKVSEVANVILFLLEESSNYINGETIVIDGGYSVW